MSSTTAGVPAMGPFVGSDHFTSRRPTVLGLSSRSAELYRVPSESWLYIGQSFGSPETNSAPLGTSRSSSASNLGAQGRGRSDRRPFGDGAKRHRPGRARSHLGNAMVGPLWLGKYRESPRCLAPTARRFVGALRRKRPFQHCLVGVRRF